MYQVVCFLLVCVSVLQASPYNPCVSTAGQYTSVTVSDCATTDKNCVLRRNKNATISIQFDVNKNITAVNTIVHGILAGIPVPFPMANADACAFKGSGLNCPLTTNGGPYFYTTTLFVEKQYPKISLVVKFELKDEESADIVCVQIASEIQ